MLHRRSGLTGATARSPLLHASVLQGLAALLIVWAGASLARRWPMPPWLALLLALVVIALLLLKRHRTQPAEPPAEAPLAAPAAAAAVRPNPPAATGVPPAAPVAPPPAMPPTATAAPGGSANPQDPVLYTISHDLRAPIRVIEGFARIVREDYGSTLDRVGNDHLERILGAAARMNGMIDTILALARLGSQPIARQPVHLSQMARQVLDELQRQQPQRPLRVAIAPDLIAQADPTLLRMVLDNLLGNAWKYSARRPVAEIEFGARPGPDGRPVYFVRDNGAGFDMRFAQRLFQPFQRLHSASDYAGSGVGLASVRRIIERHGGTISAEAEVDQGATFRFTLG